MAAHELFKLPVSANGIDPFESMLREKSVISSPGSLSSELKSEKDHLPENNAVSPQQSPQVNIFQDFEPKPAKHGISP
jgi:hypothetical protein